MKIRFELDTKPLLALFQKVVKKTSYATSNALTRTAKEMQAEGQKELVSAFTVRKRFIVTRLQILQYSRVTNLTVVVGINANVQGSPLLIGFFEEGGMKQPTHGDLQAVPITGSPARPTFDRAITSSLKYTNLQIANGKGKRKTFVVPGVGIFERLQKGNAPGSTVLIYKFESNVPLKKHIRLIEVMIEVVQQRFNAIWIEEFEKEVARLKK